MAFFNEFPHTRTYDSDLGWLIKKLGELIEEEGTNTENITELQTQFSGLSESVQTLLEKIFPDLAILNNIVCAGDSYGAQTGGWADKLIGRVEGFGGHGVNKCISGASFANLSFNNCISDMEADDSVTAVIICGGYNESATEGLVQAGIQSFMNLAKSKFKNARIYIGFVGWNFLLTAEGAAKRLELVNSIFPRYVLYGRSYGATYLKGVENVMHNKTLYQSDYVHPNDLGSTYLCNAILNGIQGGGIDVFYQSDTVSINYDANINPLGNPLTMAATMYNDVMHVMAFNWRMVFVNDITIARGVNEITIGTYSSNLLEPIIHEHYGEFPISMAALVRSSNAFVQLQGSLWLDETGVIKLKILNTDQIAGVSSIFVHGFNANILNKYI